MKKKHKHIEIQYLPNYKVKYCFFKEPIKECEGGGWYTVIGHELRCHASLFKFEPKTIPCNIEDLTEVERYEYFKEKVNYENSQVHKSRIQSFTQLSKNALLNGL
jgi:hypothetical protein